MHQYTLGAMLLESRLTEKDLRAQVDTDMGQQCILAAKANQVEWCQKVKK